MDQPDRSEQTQMRYLATAEQLQRRAAREMQLPPELLPSPITLVQWLIQLRPTLRPASWRQYRASVFALLDDMNSEEAGLAILELLQADSTPCLRRPAHPRTSGQKMRRLPQAELDKLLAHLAAHPSRWSVGLALWLQAGRLTGLRPCEWPSARLLYKDDEPVLKVRNAKNSNGRSHGEFRHLRLGLLDADALQIVVDMLAWVQQIQTQHHWEAVTGGCRDTLTRVTRQLWPRRKRFPTLYSTRHQFAADAKKSGMPPVELAALMGHAVADTVVEHYGRRTHGQGGFSIQADPDDVARVIDRPVTWDEKHRFLVRVRA